MTEACTGQSEELRAWSDGFTSAERMYNRLIVRTRNAAFEAAAVAVMEMSGVDLGVQEIVADEIRDMKLPEEE